MHRIYMGDMEELKTVTYNATPPMEERSSKKKKRIYTHGHFDDVDLDAMSQWLGRGKNSAFELSRQLSKQYILTYSNSRPR